MESWLSILASGKFETHLTRLVLRGASQESHEGSGQIVWTSTEGIRLRAITTSETTPFDGGTNYQVGKIIPREALLQLEGETHDSWNGICENIPADHTYSFLTEERVWDTPLWCLHLCREIETDRPSRLVGLFRPSQTLTFSNTSKVIDDNPAFGGTSNTLDWLTFSTTGETITIRKQKDDQLYISIEASLSLEEFERVMESLRLALSFIEGRPVEIVGFEAVCRGLQHRKVYRTGKKRDGIFSPPLPRYSTLPGQHGVLLQKATQFFHTQRGREYSDSLRMCWDCVDNYSSIRAITTCAALENLIRLVGVDLTGSGNAAGHSAASESDPDQETLGQALLLEHLEKNKERYGERNVNRVRGIFTSSNKAQPESVLYNWLDSGFLAVEREDILAWKKLRHSVAHGHLPFNVPDTSVMQVSQDRQNRIDRLINKIMMHAIKAACEKSEVSFQSTSGPRLP